MQEHFAAGLAEAKPFIKSKGLAFPTLKKPARLDECHCVVVMTAHLRTLNKTLQGIGGTALHMLEEMLVLER